MASCSDGAVWREGETWPISNEWRHCGECNRLVDFASPLGVSDHAPNCSNYSPRSHGVLDLVYRRLDAITAHAADLRHRLEVIARMIDDADPLLGEYVAAVIAEQPLQTQCRGCGGRFELCSCVFGAPSREGQ